MRKCWIFLAPRHAIWVTCLQALLLSAHLWLGRRGPTIHRGVFSSVCVVRIFLGFELGE